jgi:hypothetical protein
LAQSSEFPEPISKTYLIPVIRMQTDGCPVGRKASIYLPSFISNTQYYGQENEFILCEGRAEISTSSLNLALRQCLGLWLNARDKCARYFNSTEVAP